MQNIPVPTIDGGSSSGAAFEKFIVPVSGKHQKTGRGAEGRVQVRWSAVRVATEQDEVMYVDK